MPAPGEPVDPLVAISRLARSASAGGELIAVFREAIDILVAHTQAEHVTILEAVDSGAAARVRAGVGFAGGTAGAMVGILPGGHLAFTLGADAPVVVEDLRAETRFEASPALLELGVTSSLSVAIPAPGGGRAYGVIGIHSIGQRVFASADIRVTETVAAILGLALDRWVQALELNDSAIQSLVLARYALAGGDVEQARARVDAALAGTRALVAEVIGDQALPGDLRRGRRAAPDTAPPDPSP